MSQRSRPDTESKEVAHTGVFPLNCVQSVVWLRLRLSELSNRGTSSPPLQSLFDVQAWLSRKRRQKREERQEEDEMRIKVKMR